jgi:hypothetical protein
MFARRETTRRCSAVQNDAREHRHLDARSDAVMGAPINPTQPTTMMDRE